MSGWRKRQVAAQPEQEPVAHDNCRAERICRSWCGNFACVSHYADTTPPQRKPLTDEEIDRMYVSCKYGSVRELARAIEAAHDIKE